MKKNLLISIGIIGIILIFAGCGVDVTSPPDQSGLILRLDSSSVPSKTITPGIDMEVATYDIKGSGPDSASFELLGVTTPAVTVEDLASGDWLIEVDAKNAAATIIGYGNVNVTILKGEIVSATVNVTPVEGNGAISLTVDWSAATQFTTSATVTGTVELKTQTGYDAPIALIFTPGGLNASCSQTLANGYYRLSLEIQETGVDSAYFIDAVRIVYNVTTSATITIADKPEVGGVTITVDVDMQDPITITFAGVEDELIKGFDMTVTATTIPSPVDSYQWYLDNVALPGETSASITIGSSLDEGTYELKLMVDKGVIMGCDSVFFTVVLTGGPVETLLDDFNDGDIINLFGGENGQWGDGGTTSYQANGGIGDSGCLKLAYNMDNGWVGDYFLTGDGAVQTDMIPRDISMYDAFSFWVKTGVGQNCTFVIDFKDNLQNEIKLNVSNYLPGGTTASYQKVTIPLADFAGLDTTQVIFVLFIYEPGLSPAAGDIYFDDMLFSSSGGSSSSISSITSSISSSVSSSAGNLFDDFNDGNIINLFGGENGQWGDGGTTSYQVNGGIGDSGCLKLAYNMDNGWVGDYFLTGDGAVQSNMIPRDLSMYDSFSFWVKTGAGQNCTFVIDFKDNVGNEIKLNVSSYLPGGTTASYQKVTVPLADFVGLDTTQVIFVLFIYEPGLSPAAGDIYFDDMEFNN